MATDIRVPTLGESVTEATIGQWFKKVGDVVAADEPVVELETDKVTIEVPAPAAGVLESITANPGDTVNVGALIGAIGAAGSVAAAAPVAAKAAEAPAAVVAEAKPASSMAPAPSAQKLMAENNIAMPTSTVRASAARSSRKTCWRRSPSPPLSLRRRASWLRRQRRSRWRSRLRHPLRLRPRPPRRCRRGLRSTLPTTCARSG